VQDLGDFLVWLLGVLDLLNTTQYLGIPYKKNGRDLSGLDCYGLMMILDEKLPEYKTPDDNHLIYKLIQENMDLFEELENPEPLCYVLFQTGPMLLHIGKVLEDCQRFIHIIQRRNVSLERLDHFFWKQKIIGFYKWKK
jgi:probable lipoprotein NlpC